MKKTRLIILLAALTCLAALALVGCGDDSHAHDFGGEWAHDSESHWHACAEEGCDGVADKAAHTFGEATPGAAATCYSNGTETYTCSECGFVKTAETDTLEHTPATTLSHDGSAHWYACTADGCTAHLSETKHEWSGWSLSETNTPTLTAGGKVTRECTVDGCGGVGEYVLPALTSVYYTVSDNDATIYAGGHPCAPGMGRGAGL